jgi:hypothetical protein
MFVRLKSHDQLYHHIFPSTSELTYSQTASVLASEIGAKLILLTNTAIIDRGVASTKTARQVISVRHARCGLLFAQPSGHHQAGVTHSDITHLRISLLFFTSAGMFSA